MRRRVHPTRNRHGLKLGGHGYLQEFVCRLARCKPHVEGSRGENERHAIVHRPHELVGGGGDYGERLERLAAVRVTPAVPEPREGDGAMVATAEEVGLLG